MVGAGKWQLQVVEEGLRLDWEGDKPARYRKPNNKSAQLRMEKVEMWMAAGQVEKVEQQPWCTNPLSVAVKYDPVTDTTKFRPVIDVKELKVKLDDLQTSEVLINKGDFMASFDLENQFFHVHLYPGHRKFLALLFRRRMVGRNFIDSVIYCRTT